MSLNRKKSKYPTVCSKKCFYNSFKQTSCNIKLSKEEKAFITQLSKDMQLTPCSASIYLKYRFGKDFDCCDLNIFIKPNDEISIKIPPKKAASFAKRPLKPYDPCAHEGSCASASCPCYSKKSYCEYFCMCSCCDNTFFCKCQKCDEKCKCFLNSRECTLLCHNSCDNKRMQKKETKHTIIDHSFTAGIGLFAGEDLKKEDLLFEYVGELISNLEADRRGYFYDHKKVSYLFDLLTTKDYGTIDATRIGNNSRFINHADKKKANLYAKALMVNGVVSIGLFAAKNIKIGEELLFDYCYTANVKKKHNISD